MEIEWLEYYERAVIRFYDDTAAHSAYSKEQNARETRDASFAGCYKQLVLA